MTLNFKINYAVHLLFLVVSSIYSITVSAILPEQIGGSQYAVGVINSSQMEVLGLEKRFAPNHPVPVKIVSEIERLLQSGGTDVKPIMQSLKFTSAEKELLIRTIALLQEQGRSKGASVFMIGSDRAIAVDGHHRLRSQGKLYEIMESAGDLWPEQTRSILKPLGRVSDDGKFVNSLHLEESKLKVVKTLPENINAESLMRELLEQGKGVWQDQKLNELGKSYFGQASKNASMTDLKILANGLGIFQDPSGKLKLTAISALPDDPWRSILGYHFFNRGISISPIGFVDYVEFYVDDLARHIMAQSPGKYPALEELTHHPTFEEQTQHKIKAADEFDEIIAAHPEVRDDILKHATSSKENLISQLARIQFKVCNSRRGAGIPDCVRFLSTLTQREKKSLRALVKLSSADAIKTPLALSDFQTSGGQAAKLKYNNCIQGSLKSLITIP